MLHFGQHQRLRQIQKSNLHVKNLIESAKRMIYNQDNLGKNEKEILEVKISIQKDHLKNSFYKINYPDNNFNLQIIENNSQKLPSKSLSVNNQPKSTIKLSTTQSFDQQNQNRCKQTKIVISRVVEKDLPAKRVIVNCPLSLKQSQFTQNHKREKQTARTYMIEQPENNTRIVIKTIEEPIFENDQAKMTQSPSKIGWNKSSQYQPKQSIMSSGSKQQRFQLKQYLNKEPYFQQEINLSTPERVYKIKNTSIVEDLDYQTSQNKMENRFQREKEENQEKSSRRSTPYKEILQKNKQKLKNSREKSQTVLRNPSYELDLQKLYEKKQEGKKRLYGQNYENKSTQLNSFSGSHSKYSIALSQKDNKQSNSNLKSGRSTNREKSNTFRSNRSQLSQQRNNSLHSKLIKGIQMPCTSPCLKCKSRINKRQKQKHQPLSQFHLAKKYLTPEGEQECYNFLRSQGIEEKDWPIFITEYVYRQLSKAYNQCSPKDTSQTTE